MPTESHGPDPPTEPEPNRMGRPRLPIDADQVFKLARLGCSNAEIGDWFGCAASTVTNRLQDELTRGRACMRISLRRAQLRRAARGSDAMLIHLGKYVLGQREGACQGHDEAAPFPGWPTVKVSFRGGEPGSLDKDRREAADDDQIQDFG